LILSMCSAFMLLRKNNIRFATSFPTSKIAFAFSPSIKYNTLKCRFYVEFVKFGYAWPNLGK